MISPVKLEEGGVYLLQVEQMLSKRQRDSLQSYLVDRENKFGIKFIVVDGGIKLACSINTEGMSFQEIMTLVKDLKS